MTDEQENNNTTLSIVKYNHEQAVDNIKHEKRVFTDVVAGCQLLLENSGGLFEFPMPPKGEPVVVGRRVQHTDMSISINLAPFNGFSLGVSRSHAAFERAGTRLFIRDLGSTNGTRLNGEKLIPNHVYEVHHGDKIIFGQLPTLLYIR